MGDWLLSEPPWIAGKEPDWGARREVVLDEYERRPGVGSLRQATMMLSRAWDDWQKRRERD